MTDGAAFDDAIEPFFSLEVELIGPLKKQLNTSLCSPVAFLLSTVAVGTGAVGVDKPNKSELNKFESLVDVFSVDVELVLMTTRDDVFGLLELFCKIKNQNII